MLQYTGIVIAVIIFLVNASMVVNAPVHYFQRKRAQSGVSARSVSKQKGYKRPGHRVNAPSFQIAAVNATGGSWQGI